MQKNNPEDYTCYKNDLTKCFKFLIFRFESFKSYTVQMGLIKSIFKIIYLKKQFKNGLVNRWAFFSSYTTHITVKNIFENQSFKRFKIKIIPIFFYYGTDFEIE